MPLGRRQQPRCLLPEQEPPPPRKRRALQFVPSAAPQPSPVLFDQRIGGRSLYSEPRAGRQGRPSPPDSSQAHPAEDPASCQLRPHPSSRSSENSERHGCGASPAPPYDVEQDPLCADASLGIPPPPLLLAIKVSHCCLTSRVMFRMRLHWRVERSSSSRTWSSGRRVFPR